MFASSMSGIESCVAHTPKFVVPALIQVDEHEMIRNPLTKH
jgi:hypothetical protein